jgi:3-phenylpropionate/trans-cinnamate dioxygenase ferredoxin reductase subunit
MTSRVVIVGAGHAGGTAAVLLRQFGHQGDIALIGKPI